MSLLTPSASRSPCKTASQPLITKPAVPLKDLATGVMMGVRDEDTVSSLAGRLARLNKQLDDKEQARITRSRGRRGARRYCRVA